MSAAQVIEALTQLYEVYDTIDDARTCLDGAERAKKGKNPFPASDKVEAQFKKLSDLEKALQAIAAKATGSFVSWLPNAHGPMVASKAQPAPKTDTASRPPARKKVAMVSASSAETTGSIGREGGLTAVVPSVTGAPGDGGTSLTAAIRRELKAKGVSLADRATPATYRVEGVVTLHPGQGGKQPALDLLAHQVRIDDATGIDSGGEPRNLDPLVRADCGFGHQSDVRSVKRGAGEPEIAPRRAAIPPTDGRGGHDCLRETRRSAQHSNPECQRLGVERARQLVDEAFGPENLHRLLAAPHVSGAQRQVRGDRADANVGNIVGQGYAAGPESGCLLSFGTGERGFQP